MCARKRSTSRPARVETEAGRPARSWSSCWMSALVDPRTSHARGSFSVRHAKVAIPMRVTSSSFFSPTLCCPRVPKHINRWTMRARERSTSRPAREETPRAAITWGHVQHGRRRTAGQGACPRALRAGLHACTGGRQGLLYRSHPRHGLPPDAVRTVPGSPVARLYACSAPERARLIRAATTSSRQRLPLRLPAIADCSPFSQARCPAGAARPLTVRLETYPTVARDGAPIRGAPERWHGRSLSRARPETSNRLARSTPGSSRLATGSNMPTCNNVADGTPGLAKHATIGHPRGGASGGERCKEHYTEPELPCLPVRLTRQR